MSDPLSRGYRSHIEKGWFVLFVSFGTLMGIGFWNHPGGKIVLVEHKTKAVKM